MLPDNNSNGYAYTEPQSIQSQIKEEEEICERYKDDIELFYFVLAERLSSVDLNEKLHEYFSQEQITDLFENKL